MIEKFYIERGFTEVYFSPWKRYYDPRNLKRIQRTIVRVSKSWHLRKVLDGNEFVYMILEIKTTEPRTST